MRLSGWSLILSINLPTYCRETDGSAPKRPEAFADRCYGMIDWMYASICGAAVLVAPVPIAPAINAGPLNPDR